MPISSSDLIQYGAANMPESDAVTTGGAIDKTIEMLGTDMNSVGGTDKLKVVSDNAGDTTQSVTITGRAASGIIIANVYSLNGLTTVVGTSNFERVLKIVVSGTHVGTITVKADVSNSTLATLAGTASAPGGVAVLQKRRIFYKALANASGGATKVFYEKLFIANTHVALALLDAGVRMSVDGTTNALLDFTLEDARNDNNSVVNRLTLPTGLLGVPTWDNAIKLVPGVDLGDRTTGTGDHIGVWVRMTLPAGEAPENKTFTFEITGSTT